MWTENFQMFKLDLEKAEEPEIKLPTSVGTSKKPDNSRKTSTSSLLITPKLLTVWITINYGKFFKRWEYQTTLPASWEILFRSRRNRIRHGTMDWFQIGKGVCQDYVLSPCLFNLYAEYNMQNPRLDEAQTGIKIAGEISITSGMQMTPPYGRKQRRTKDFIFLGSKITVDSEYSHEIKRLLLLGRKTMTNLDSILKSRDITCRQRSI